MVGNGLGQQRQVEQALASFSTPFRTLVTAEQNVQFSIEPQNGLTRRRYLWYSDGSLFDKAYFSNVDAGIRLETTSTATDEARIHSAIAGKYISQTLAKPGMGLYIPDQYTTLDENNQISLTNGQVFAGAFWWDDANDQVDTGIGFEWNTDGWYFFVKSNGQHLGDSPILQDDFNIDSLDADGPSGQINDPPIGYVYNWPYTWYNEGPFEAGYLSKVSNNFEEAHREFAEGPSLDTPNLPVQLVVRNNGDAQPLAAELGGMQYSTYGGGIDNVEFRETDESRITSNGYLDRSKVLLNNAVDPDGQVGRPLISFRRESGARDVSLAIQELDIRPVSDDIYVFQWDEWNADSALTGQTFNKPVTTTTISEESKIFTDTQATDYTPSGDSVLRSVRLVEGGSKNQTGSAVTQRIDARVPIGATRVITAVNDGDADADVDPFMVKAEESF